MLITERWTQARSRRNALLALQEIARQRKAAESDPTFLRVGPAAIEAPVGVAPTSPGLQPGTYLLGQGTVV